MQRTYFVGVSDRFGTPNMWSGEHWEDAALQSGRTVVALDLLCWTVRSSTLVHCMGSPAAGDPIRSPRRIQPQVGV